MLIEKEEWLSLSQAAALLGVHPGTLRLWSDQGRLPVHRTQGKHRRYKRSEVELWARASRRPRDLEPGNILQFALRRIRFKVAEGQLEAEDWYQRLDGQAREQYRLSGRSLVQGLANYLTSQGQEAIGEAHSLGYEYARLGRRYSLDTVQAARAFLFFRNVLLESLMAVYQEAWVPAGSAWAELLTRMLAFTDQILLTLLETYHTLEGGRP